MGDKGPQPIFRKFNPKDDISGQTMVKSSDARKIRKQLLDDMPLLEPILEELLPKKEKLRVAKCNGSGDHINLLVDANGEVVFFNQRDGPYAPTLRFLHQYPALLPHCQVDRGGIRFVLSGANVMAPGLTSAGGKMDPVLEGDLVAIHAEGKECAMAIGVMKMGSVAITEINKGISIDNLHYLNDGLWNTSNID